MLKKGFSTGSVSAAVIKASIRYYFEPEKFDSIEIKMPGNENADIKISRLGKRKIKRKMVVSNAAAVKDSGSDGSDVTGGIKICAGFTVIGRGKTAALKKYYGNLSVYSIIKNSQFTLMLASSKGVGIVSRPGLPVKPGRPSINPVPLKMIELAASEELHRAIKKYYGDWNKAGASALKHKIFASVLYIPKGEEVAKKTLNPRLGIVGGISILGTTGYVVPISTKAWLETIKASLAFLAENKIDTCVYTPGRYSEKIAMKFFKALPRESFIEIGDYVSYSIRKAVKSGIKKIILAGQFGKIIKIAQGARNTNAKYGGVNFNFLGKIIEKSFKNLKAAGSALENIPEERKEYLRNAVINSNTSRQAYGYIIADEFETARGVIFDNILKAALKNLNGTDEETAKAVNIRIILISSDGEIIRSSG